MLDGITNQVPVPDELLGPLADASQCLTEPTVLRRWLADHGYVFLRDVLDRDLVLAARREAFTRLEGMGEILPPAEAGVATGASQRWELAADLGAFWKSVSEGPALRRVTHGPRLRELAGLSFDAPARPHDYLFLRPAGASNDNQIGRAHV